MKPCINVSVIFFSPDEGGRKESIYLNDYRPHFRIIDGSEYLGVQFIEAPDKVITPDEKVDTKVLLLYFPDVSYNKLRQNTEFEILEGAKVVGKGKVISLTSADEQNELPLPFLAFKLDGMDDSIELTIDEVWGYPNETSYGGGYGAKGKLSIRAGEYMINNATHYFTTGELYNFLQQMEHCYEALDGVALACL